MNKQARQFDDETCLLVGRRILEAYNQWTEMPMGKSITIPILIPNQNSDQPPWAMNIACDMPWFIEDYWENGERKSKHWSLKEYMRAK
jgi:hypothetical protein